MPSPFLSHAKPTKRSVNSNSAAIRNVRRKVDTLSSKTETIDTRLQEVEKATETTTLESAGGEETLVVDGTGPVLSTKGLTSGTGITLTSSANDITISGVDPTDVTDLQSKTQNILSGNTDPTKTTFDQDLICQNNLQIGGGLTVGGNVNPSTDNTVNIGRYSTPLDKERINTIACSRIGLLNFPGDGFDGCHFIFFNNDGSVTPNRVRMEICGQAVANGNTLEVRSADDDGTNEEVLFQINHGSASIRPGLVRVTNNLNVDGGMDVGGGMNVAQNGGLLTVFDTTDATSVSTGSVSTAGGLGVAKTIYCEGSVVPSSGNLKVFGGLYAGFGNRPAVTGGFSSNTDVSVFGGVLPAPISIAGAGFGSLTTPANAIKVGSTSILEAGGVVTTQNAAHTLNLTLRINGSVVQTIQMTFAKNLVSSPWILKTVINCRTPGQSGSLMYHSFFSVLNSNGIEPLDANGGSVNTVATDTTVPLTFDTFAQWEANSDPADEFICKYFTTHNAYQPL